MNIEQIRDALPDYARDLKLNLGSVLTTNGAPGLNEKQIWSIALASAIAARNTGFARSVEAESRAHLADVEVEGAKAAAAIMGMNNIYYRFLHLVEDGEYQTMPARLRMNVIANHGIDKLDFELISLAVSAVNGCGLCVTSHEKKLRSHDVSREVDPERGAHCGDDSRRGRGAGVRAERAGRPVPPSSLRNYWRHPLPRWPIRRRPDSPGAVFFAVFRAVDVQREREGLFGARRGFNDRV